MNYVYGEIKNLTFFPVFFISKKRKKTNKYSFKSMITVCVLVCVAFACVCVYFM